ncbi:MAG: hypothetical protein K6E97_09260, partial [Treponema sp.]|nr:hypothetical protein [Treponema sp.]
MAEKLREIKEDKLKIFSTPLENCTIKDGKSFIMGKKAFWHNGIHFLSSESVHTVYTGQIVAYRYISNYKTLDIEIPEDIEEDYLGIYKITTPEQIEILKRYY